MIVLLVVLTAIATWASAEDHPLTSVGVNSYDANYGVYLGDLPNLADGDVSGMVYVINDTALQIVNFTYNGNAPDLYFWLDKEETPTTKGVKIPSFEFGITPLGPYENAERVVLILPNQYKLMQFRSFSLFCYKYEHNFGSLVIPETLSIPKPQFLNGELKGSRYAVGSGPILIINRRTIKVYAFNFDGDKAPDGYFFVGRGPTVGYDTGVKVPIKGRDTPELITAMNERYRGGQDIYLTLPEGYEVEHIDWLSIFCYKFRVDFGHVAVSNVSQRIPPYVPHQKRFDEIDNSKMEKWAVTSLLGTDNRRNFTFQLGLPGGKKGYQAMARARPSKYVWYVNGYLADIYLARGVTYTFIVEGGDDKSTSDFFNPLYISDDQFGGYGKLSNDEREQVHIYTETDPSSVAGRLCVWSSDDADNADQFDSFIEFRHTLNLKCEQDKEPAIFTFTPDEKTPDTLYYQSFSSYNMGWKIHVVNKLPLDIDDIQEEPYDYEHWRKHKQSLRALTAGASQLVSVLAFAPLLLLLL